MSLNGVTSSARGFLVALLHRLAPGREIVAVADGVKNQELLEQDVRTWSRLLGGAEAPPLFYPAWEHLPHEGKLPHADVLSERLETLLALRGPSTGPGRGRVIVTRVEALLQRTLRPEGLQARTRELAQGNHIDPLDLVEWLEEQGYEPETQVTQKGELALRGGILDVFPLTSPWPVRCEFFGDELESLRLFDPLTQVSRETVPSVLVPPAGELGLLQRELAAPARGDGPATPPGALIDYLSSEALLVLCEPGVLAEQAAAYQAQVPAGDSLFAPWAETLQAAAERGMVRVMLGEESVAAPGSNVVMAELESLEAFRPLVEKAPEPQVAEVQRKEFFHQIHRWLRQQFAVHVFCNNQGEQERFTEIWRDYNLGEAPDQTLKDSNPPGREGLQVHVGGLSRGFLWASARMVVITDAEVFGRYRVQRPRRLRSPHAQATRSALDIDFSDLEEGDLVVHLQHGIGRYLGLHAAPPGVGSKALEVAGRRGGAGPECLVIEYAPNDPAQPAPKLYVPVNEAHLVSKYVGAGKARPPLNTLGGTRWARAKAQAERAVRDIAAELLTIQAAREAEPGHSFAPDSTWQREFEAAFIYEETPDQMKAILESKADMERAKPMDRLICGDVGFGKTEVGIRAAFKAVMGGKQVAVLVPTTVLAQQHFNQFRERMADYPVRVELLSRFRTRRAQQQVVRDLAQGSVDIVIGTHRLLQSDIHFKDLGLVVIDEEQRFGVLHKEKFKLLRRLVDMLTLSATPIPRTLYLALAGARDMSTIQTPPHDRLPVETIVTQYDERLIRDAIQRELNRGGQVFFLHNRVMTIHVMAEKLQALVPQARLVVGHGQMHNDDLEEVMTRFVNGEADVLLSTTIIESGLDIPNANTIIIDRADRFGLSDLYQLRGRVGRYKHQAYAYLLLPRHARLLTDVRKRMSAIRQYSTLGSGFKIAMRDLEIRGAGNLLGAQQSGHITAVGFDLYCQLLKQSVAGLKGEKVKPRVDVQVRLDFLALSPGRELPSDDDLATPLVEAPGEAAYIPFRYIADARQRIEVYRKLAQADEKAALTTLEHELRDRFGPLPKPVVLLLQVADLKLLAAGKHVTAIEVKDAKLMLTRHQDYIMIGGKFPRLARKETEARLKEIRKVLLAL